MFEKYVGRNRVKCPTFEKLALATKNNRILAALLSTSIYRGGIYNIENSKIHNLEQSLNNQAHIQLSYQEEENPLDFAKTFTPPFNYKICV